jgi:microcystin-dependent protein
MAEPFIGEIRMFAFQNQTPPQGWAECNGQLLSIQQNTALYSLLGTAFGGDGRTTFALPNLKGRVPMHPPVGGKAGTPGGEEAHVLTDNEMPQHNHLATAGTNAMNGAPAGNVWGSGGVLNNYAQQPNVQMGVNALATTGQSQAHPNMQPYTVVNFCIATVGIFPSRN